MQYIIGIFIAFFLALLIFTKKGRNRADVILENFSHAELAWRNRKTILN